MEVRDLFLISVSGVAQWVECLAVAEVVAGSIPVLGPVDR